jgi:hypothetical protein
MLRPVGFTTVHTTIPDTIDVPATTNFLFHPDIFTSFHASDTLRLVLPGEACESDTDPPGGFSTYSGNYLLVCISTAVLHDEDLERENLQIYLIRFVKGPPASIQARRLPIPVFIESELESENIDSIALDDHLGVLYLTSLRGFIFAVPFA